MKEFKYKPEFGEYDVNVLVRQYADRSRLAIELVASRDDPKEDLYEGSPIATLTVNLPHEEISFCEAHVDTNNTPAVEKFLTETGLAKPTGISRQSGYWSYPVYLFNAEKLVECDPEGFAEYSKNFETRNAEFLQSQSPTLA